ncbi:DUF3267 domain-containing protein [Vagococcus zengguangii]|uniref:DUF3267 domain-containing protein n=1 Tax=Vagococcus zengguangii TaxID=2571750 RepID=A0A4D7CX97_9ENTE|nr:DUF3267 domain-containing protein [Vagococcus zengguangii]QCI86496.1 DUF3267 domain-containing protein [Vagococcus zengguangii]TLG81254.1 DUF3267 domain-containing protein [Vagococcus zengguangii]
MELYREINLIDNNKIIFWLNVISIPLFIIFYFMFSLIATFNNQSISADLSIFMLLIVLVSYFVLIIIHELIHGIFFKLFNKEGKVKFGVKNGLAYATSPGFFYSKTQFIVVLLAPFTLISIGLYIFYLISIVSSFVFVTLASLHAASCIGDFYFTWLVARAPESIVVEDTEQGMSFYHNLN